MDETQVHDYADLDPDTVYYYRFVYVKGGEHLASRTARTRTAPDRDADRHGDAHGHGNGDEHAQYPGLGRGRHAHGHRPDRHAQPDTDQHA